MPNRVLTGFVSVLGLIFISSMMAVPVFSSPSPQLLEMKIKMVGASLKRKRSAVNSESTEEETSELNRVHDALESAKVYLNEGKLETADQQLSQAIQWLSASGKVNKASSVEKERYQTLVDDIKTYHQEIEQASKGKSADFHGIPVKEIDGVLMQSQQLAERDDYVGANTLLNNLYEQIIGVLTELRKNETVVYTLEFSSPLHEFEYELERNHSYEKLLHITISNKQLPSGMQSLVDRYVQHAKNKKTLAEMMAEREHYAQGIITLEESTGSFSKALRLLGVMAP
ncbi:MAG: hypothetical protein V7699_00560 [Porticoccus sp.]